MSRIAVRCAGVGSVCSKWWGMWTLSGSN